MLYFEQFMFRVNGIYTRCIFIYSNGNFVIISLPGMGGGMSHLDNFAISIPILYISETIELKCAEWEATNIRQILLKTIRETRNPNVIGTCK